MVIMDYQNIGKFCKNLMIANGNIRIIVMAEGYNINSQIIQAAIAAGVSFFMLGTNAGMLKNELLDALDGKTNIEAVFEQLPTEDQRDKKKNEIENVFSSAKTIAIAGSMHRIGTTTQALQIVKHLILKGYTAYCPLGRMWHFKKFQIIDELGISSYLLNKALNELAGLKLISIAVSQYQISVTNIYDSSEKEGHESSNNEDIRTENRGHENLNNEDTELKKEGHEIGVNKDTEQYNIYQPESVKPINSKIPKCRLQAVKQSRKPLP